MAESTLRASISDMELLAAFEAKEICIYMDTYKNKKTNQTVYTTELRYVASGKPVLARDGYIDTTGTVLFGPFSKEDRMKPGNFPKANRDTNDEAKVTFGTKYSGTFGALVARIDAVEWPAAVANYAVRSRAKNPGTDDSIHRAFSICKKKLGSPAHPVEAKKAADYIEAADWRYTMSYRFRLSEDPKTKTMKWGPFLFKVVEYHLNATGDGVEEVPVDVNRDNVIDVFARGTVVNIHLSLGNPTCIESEGSGISIYYPSFNANNTIIVGKPAPKGERKINISDQEKLAKAKALAASAGGMIRGPPPAAENDGPDPEDGPEHDEDGPPASAPPSTVAQSGASLAASLAGLALQDK